MIRNTAGFVAGALAGYMALSASASNSAESVTPLSQDAATLQDRMPRNPPASGNSLAVSGLFDSDGGTLTATAADGTKFILTIPPDATVLPLEITMTPVSGHRPSESVAAVKIEPDGAFLWQPADLKIVPPTPPDLKSLSYFRYGGPDESLTFYPGLPGATEIEMAISYLASYGVGPDGMWTIPTQRDDRRQSARRLSVSAGSAASTSLSPYVARVADVLKQALEQAADPDNQEIYAIWNEAWTDVVFPALDSLGSGCDPGSLEPVMKLAFEFMHLDAQSDDPNLNSIYYPDTAAIVKDRVLSCIEEHYQLCKSQNDPTQVQLIWQLERQLELAQLLSDEEIANVRDLIAKCLQFEIDFESALTATSSVAGQSLTDHMKVRAIVPVQLQYVEVGGKTKAVMKGSAQISHELDDIEGSICTYTATTRPDTFVVDLLGIGLYKKDTKGEVTGVPLARTEIQVNLVYFTGDPEEQMTQYCDAGPAGIVTTQFPFEPVFKGYYGNLHADEAIPGGDGGYDVWNQPPWELIRSGNIFAKAQYLRTKNFGLGPISEETYIFLKHTPQ